MCDHHRRVSSQQLKIGEDAIKLRLKGMRYRLYKRVCANIGVYSSGNEVGLTNLSLLRWGQYADFLNRSVKVKEKVPLITGHQE
jgi:hypothetical protein